MKKICICLFLILCVLGCGRYKLRMDANIESFKEENFSGEYRTFSLLAIDKINPLKEEHLFSYIKNSLIDAGYVYNQDTPDFLVIFNVQDVEKYIPPSVYNAFQYVSGQTSNVTMNSYGKFPQYGTVTTPGYFTNKQVSSGGYTEHHKHIHVDFLDNKRSTPKKLKYIYQSSITFDRSTERKKDFKENFEKYLKYVFRVVVKDYEYGLEKNNVKIKVLKDNDAIVISRND